MKRHLKIFSLLLLVVSILLPTNVFAATGKYTISSNSTVEVGDTITVKFTISGSNLFYWQSYITYDTARLQLVSGSTNFQGESDNINGVSSTSQTLKFKAKKTGAATVSIAMGNKENNINSNSQEVSFSKVTKTITVKEKTIVTYSSNNNLKGLSIEGATISPAFNKNTLEYNVELPANTTEINVIAQAEDSKAKISGAGKVNVSEGLNKLTIKVTAENGNNKSYVINATVKELEPIEVTVNGETFTVVRKKDQLPKASSSYEETTVKINNEEVPALKSEITKYNLIALKDTEGTIDLYIYDETNNSYTLYKELSFNKLTIVPVEDKSITIPKEYKSSKKTINGHSVTVYTYNNSYPIFIGLNVETGKKALYSYDEEENTVQKVKINNKDNSLNKLQNNITGAGNIDTYVIISLGLVLVITYSVILINLIKKNKLQKSC